MFMRDFWKPMPVSGKLIRELLLFFLLISMKVMQLPFLHIYFLYKKLFFRVRISLAENLKKSDRKPYRYPKNYVQT